MKRLQTPAQTIGPFFAYGLTPAQYGYAFSAIASSTLAHEQTRGERIRLQGRVLDGEGVPIDDAMIEIWQADADGRYVDPRTARRNDGFTGFGRIGTGTDADRRFVFDTIKPGPADAGQAPHVHVIVFMRGLLNHTYTRIYFSDEQRANESDPVLLSVPRERRDSLIAQRDDTATPALYHFDIHMQGHSETVFFDL